jgi:hypothetical protein
VARYLIVQPVSGLVLTADAPLYLLDTEKVGGVTPHNIADKAVMDGILIDDFNLNAAYFARPQEMTLGEAMDESAYEPWKDEYDEEQQIADHESGPDA